MVGGGGCFVSLMGWGFLMSMVSLYRRDRDGGMGAFMINCMDGKGVGRFGRVCHRRVDGSMVRMSTFICL